MVFLIHTNEDIATKVEQQYSSYVPVFGQVKIPTRYRKNPFFQKDVTCGTSRRHVIDSNFFDTTVTTASYMELFNTSVNQLDNEELSTGYFQQDGATSHTSHASTAEIQSFFGHRLISKGLWPRQSPDLTPPDYFLWGYLKGRVYQNKPRTKDALKANITEYIQAVTYWQGNSKIFFPPKEAPTGALYYSNLVIYTNKPFVSNLICYC